jgi:hypothetical protein
MEVLLKTLYPLGGPTSRFLLQAPLTKSTSCFNFHAIPSPYLGLNRHKANAPIPYAAPPSPAGVVPNAIGVDARPAAAETVPFSTAVKIFILDIMVLQTSSSEEDVGSPSPEGKQINRPHSAPDFSLAIHGLAVLVRNALGLR